MGGKKKGGGDKKKKKEMKKIFQLKIFGKHTKRNV
jgi:hypothetical protein